MARTVLITVAIATRERPSALDRCLRAVLSGRAQPREVLVVDQSRGNQTRAIVEKAAGESHSVAVRYLRQEGDGLSRSRNAAFAYAACEIVAVTDDDCVPDAGWLEELDRAFARAPLPDAVTGRVLPLGEPEPGTFATSTRASIEASDFTRRIEPWTVGTGANFATSRALVHRLGGFNERLGAGSGGGAGEDLEILDSLLRNGALVRYVPAALIFHERKPLAARIATRRSYGCGVGALCGMRLRAGDPFGLRILGRWTWMRGTLLLRALRRGETRSFRDELLVLRGTCTGLAYGWSRAARPRVPVTGR